MLPKEQRQRVPLNECVPRRLYKIGCRNLVLGVFDGKTGFIGIREKFGDEYLFTEFHWDTGPPHGTVHSVEDSGIDLPSEIEAVEGFGPLDGVSRRPVGFDRPLSEGGRGWYFKDSNEASPDIRPVQLENQALFDWLMAKERELLPEHRKQIDDYLARRSDVDDDV